MLPAVVNVECVYLNGYKRREDAGYPGPDAALGMQPIEHLCEVPGA